MKLTSLILFISCLQLRAAHDVDVLVYGGTPGGIASAVSAARLGHSVALLEYHRHLGGMSASGLGKSDIETRDAIGGLFREFVDRVKEYYVEMYGAGSENVKLCRDGYYYEPSVAGKLFDRMVAAESKVRVFRGYELQEAIRSGNRAVGLRARNRATGAVEEFRGKILVDGTYEGDLAAFAGARYRVGRESRAEFNELHAGVVYQDHETRAFLPGTTGEGDRRIPAYTYRLCFTTDPANSRILSAPPPEYDRRIYLNYIDDWKAGRFGPPRVMKDGVGHFGPFIGTVVRALSAAEIPNRKLDININPRVLGFPFGEENYAYPEAGWAEREKISMRIRNMTLGLVYFLQNDPDVPADHRALARRYNMARDEFTDNDNFPWQLYVREARRIVGRYTMSENDVILGPEMGRTRIHADSIAAGEFPIDSFPTRKREKGHDLVLEGYLFMLDNITHPFQLPYRIMTPEAVENLLVPVAASTTHIAFSTVRLEPTWMALGQAAGIAAHIAITQGRKLSGVPIDTLQRLLLERGQVLTYFKDIDRSDPAYAALQYYGTKGFFKDYYAHSRQPLDRGQAAEWLSIVKGRPVALEGSGTLTRAEMRKFFSSPDREWRDPANRAAMPDDPVLRGEFCRAAYREQTP